MNARQRRKLLKARSSAPDINTRIEAKLDLLLARSEYADRRTIAIGAASGAIAGGLAGGAVACAVTYAKALLFGVR